MKKQIEWTLGNGATATYTIELVTSKEINLDGDKSTVPCCEIKKSLTVPGMGYLGSYVKRLDAPKVVSGKTLVASIGSKVGITEEIYTQISAAVAEAEAAPEWVAIQQQIAKNEANAEALYAQHIKSGYCPKCHSYCGGDCEA